jgi:hypothetical protein
MDAWIREARSFEDERSFQGALLQELAHRFECGVAPDDPIIEQEYQKRIVTHGTRKRPDIIVHVPFNRGLVERRDESNFVATELKRRASARKAREAFETLASMAEALKYPLTIFINVVSAETHSEICPKSIAGQTVCFAVRLEDANAIVQTATSGTAHSIDEGGLDVVS